MVLEHLHMIIAVSMHANVLIKKKLTKPETYNYIFLIKNARNKIIFIFYLNSVGRKKTYI